MDFQQRLAAATQYRDQTRESWHRAQREADAAKASYDATTATMPNFGDEFEKRRKEYMESDEIKNLKADVDASKANVDRTKTMIDKLPESIRQQFGGTAITQAQRDLAKQQQLRGLSQQMAGYQATYMTTNNTYKKRVEDAFNRSIDVANKHYDSIWDGIRRRYNDWQTSLQNVKAWDKMATVANRNLLSVQSAIDTYRFQQRQMAEEKAHIARMNTIDNSYMWRGIATQQRLINEKAAINERYLRDEANKQLVVQNYRAGKGSFGELERRYS